MKLSAPLYRLKRAAKVLSRTENIPLHEALDRLAREEGFAGWSLLSAKVAASAPAKKVYPQLAPGDLVLVAARPGQGKTLLSLELAVEAMKAGHRAIFFTLEYTKRDLPYIFNEITVDPARFTDLFAFDNADTINADYIIEKLAVAPHGTLVVIDYLQLLDQRRESPDLRLQICALESFAREKGIILVFISQIDRSYDPRIKQCPDLGDVRLPNPLDLKVFNKTCFLNEGRVEFHAVS